jgi:uncharacterized protein (TIGR03437 family)
MFRPRPRSFGLAFALLVSISSLRSDTLKPSISAIENVASYGNGSISPGEMVVIFGTAIGPPQLTDLQLDAQGRVARTLAGVQVLFDGVPAPLIYVSQSQIAAMVPYGVGGKPTTQVQLTYLGVSSDAFSKAVAATAPGIFTADASGKGQGAISNADGAPNSVAHAASPGSYVTLYLTGEGQTDASGLDGTISAGVANVTAPVSMRIAGRLAQVLYAGSAPGNVNGFAQINVVIPADLQYGGNLPLVVQIGDATSQAEVTVAVAGPTAPLPGAPTAVSAIVNSTNQIAVSWTPADGRASRFHIERRVGAAMSFSEIGAVAGTLTAFVDGTPTAGVGSQYRVRAENDYGYSGYSSVATVLTPAITAPVPPNLQATATSASQIHLSWTSSAAGVVRFRIEHRTATSQYAEINQSSPAATTFDDFGLNASTAYSYRMRVETSGGLSAYSNEVTATTTQALPPAPTNLQATATSSTQVTLTWTNNATDATAIRIEVRSVSATTFTDLGPGTTLTSTGFSSLQPNTTYIFRVRAQNAAGYSGYSNEASVQTQAAAPLPPTNLQAIAVSSTQVTLSWINPTTPFVRVHLERGNSSASFFEIAALSSSTTTYQDTGLASSSNYYYRVRAEATVGFSRYSQSAFVTTPAPLKAPLTVFLVHGIGGSADDSARLAQTLLDPVLGISVPATVDWGFTWPCAKYSLAQCNASGANCTIPQGASLLAQYILAKSPPGGRIAIIGHSMGGLLARDMILSNRSGVLSSRILSALITLGTPNVGYPFVAGLDDSSLANILGTTLCTLLGQEMWSDYRTQQNQNSVIESPYLFDLNQRWGTTPILQQGLPWLAASGTFCTDPIRSFLNPVGCPDASPASDGIVCDQSARFGLNVPQNAPTLRWSSNFYAHTTSSTRYKNGKTILCTTQSLFPDYIPLYDPPASSDLVTAIRSLLNGL